MHESIPYSLPQPLVTNSHILPTWNDEPMLCVTPEKKSNNKDKLAKSVRFNSFIDTNFLAKENVAAPSEQEINFDYISSQDTDGSFLQTVQVNSSQLLSAKLDELSLAKDAEQIGEAVKKKLAQSSQLRSTINDISSVKLNAPAQCQKYANLVPLQVCQQKLIEQRELLIADTKANARCSPPSPISSQTTPLADKEPPPTLESYYKDFDFEPEYLCFPDLDIHDNHSSGLDTVPSYRAFDLIRYQRQWDNLP